MSWTAMPRPLPDALRRVDIPDFSTLVGRGAQLRQLERALLERRVTVAAIVGPRGVGKTTLAYSLARHVNRFFDNGVKVTELGPFRSVHDALWEHRSTLRDSLLIVEEAHTVPLDLLRDGLREVQSGLPLLQILLTSQTELPPDVADLTVHLGGFSAQEFDELVRRRVGGLPADQASAIYTKLQGHPLASATAVGAIRDGVLTPDELVRALDGMTATGLVGPSGSPLTVESAEGRAVVASVSEVSDELIRRLEQDPTLFYRVPFRKFEEIVAELLCRQGYRVDLTPMSRDGGKDIYVATRNDLGSFLYLVECKRYAPDRPVGVSVVRHLYGVVEAERATAGIVATTSFFSTDAVDFQRSVSFRISLQDYFGIQSWLKNGLRSARES